MDPCEALHALTANALSPRSRERDPDLVDGIVALRSATAQDPAGWRAQAAAGAGYDSGGREARIAAPTLVVHGSDDVVLDPANAALLADTMPGAVLVTLEEVGHLLYWEEPRSVAGLVARFLVGQDPRGDTTAEAGDTTAEAG
ncbi:hypothetical protein ER308_14815 [Egibacter rhizosphaerae]|uniref:Peptidase S33 tripeptidyl aminopeptidase-like C-terminal domain-containing protein n=1 Tax=Egibacter rhizosphaerae TaxID=1670831 RepID=A0A411YHW2_9ACTN|nr:alpha/beta hydrolase [Egibacter rhizosphaerae]QBI20706.1 hypothetical protein ER308_14815 [Egibacter rhizosphaerae]